MTSQLQNIASMTSIHNYRDDSVYNANVKETIDKRKGHGEYQTVVFFSQKMSNYHKI
jgi:hypothetical protein